MLKRWNVLKMGEACASCNNIFFKDQKAWFNCQDTETGINQHRYGSNWILQDDNVKTLLICMSETVMFWSITWKLVVSHLCNFSSNWNPCYHASDAAGIGLPCTIVKHRQELQTSLALNLIEAEADYIGGRWSRMNRLHWRDGDGELKSDEY